MPKKIKKSSASTSKVKPKSKFFIESRGKKPETTFEATIVPYQVLEESKELEKLRVENKNTEKDLELLQKEIEKPLGVRNKTLTNKYAARINESYSWPDLNNGKKYNIIAYAPDSIEIPVEKRPEPWFAKLSFSEYGTDFLYKFPISLFVIVDGESFYKIDQTDTVIDSAGNISESLSDDTITPYVILKNFMAGNTSLAYDYQYTTNEGDVVYYFNFEGFRVSSTVKTIAKESSVPKITLQKFTIAADVIWGDIDSKKQNLIKEKLEKKGMDTYASVIPQARATLVEVMPSFSNSNWILFTEELGTKKDKKLAAVYIEGLSNLREVSESLKLDVPKSTFRTVPSANAFIANWNKKMVANLTKK